MTTIKAHFDGKSIIPDEPVALPLNEPLTVHVEDRTPLVSSTAKRPMTGKDLVNSGLFGIWKDRTDIGDSVEYARELRKPKPVIMRSMILLDSDILIDFFRGHPASKAWFQSLNDSHIAIPGFVAMELYAGCRNKIEQAEVQSKLESYTVLWPSSVACDNIVSIFALVHLSNALGILDALIAATALAHNTPLHTFNQKHFSAVPNLQTIQPYTR